MVEPSDTSPLPGVIMAASQDPHDQAGEAAPALRPPPRVPLAVAAGIQIAAAVLLLLCGGQYLIPPINVDLLLLLIVDGLLFFSGTAILLRRPWSWWAALLLQIPLLTYEVWVACFIVSSLLSTDGPRDAAFEEFVAAITLLFAVPLALSSLTAFFYLLRPRTREIYGLRVS